MTNALAPTEPTHASPSQVGSAEMSEVVTGQLAAAVELRCGGKAHLAGASEVRLDDGESAGWVGHVYVFDLQDRDRRRRAYAWPTEVKAGVACGVHVVLHLPSILSPMDAVMRVLGGRRKAPAAAAASAKPR